MPAVAIFVDSGYLYAAGSVAAFGSRQQRAKVELDLLAAINKLRKTADAKTRDAPLLRIYWYDGVLHSGLSPEQQLLADMDDVKLRLGVINVAGQQKGVDSLIVTDLIELARNHAISDAVLLSGDEDTRIGVQIAQSFGVRVHLVGIEPRRGNQSRLLSQEADTTSEWSKADIGEMLTLKPDAVADAPIVDGGPAITGEVAAGLDEVIGAFITSLDHDQLRAIAELNPNDLIPADFDRRLLQDCGRKLGRMLDWRESAYMRGKLKEQARVKIGIE